jgi:hypothetical protein
VVALAAWPSGAARVAGYPGVAFAMDFQAMIRLFIAPLGT